MHFMSAVNVHNECIGKIVLSLFHQLRISENPVSSWFFCFYLFANRSSTSCQRSPLLHSKYFQIFFCLSFSRLWGQVRHGYLGATLFCEHDHDHDQNSVRTFQRHINKKHSEFWAQYGIKRGIQEYEIDIPGLGDDAMEDQNLADCGDGVEHDESEVDPAKHVAAFLIGIRERFKIPHEACNFVASEVGDIIEFSASHLMARVISAPKLLMLIQQQ